MASTLRNPERATTIVKGERVPFTLLQARHLLRLIVHIA